MNVWFTLSIVFGYFLVLSLVSYFSGKGAVNETFFKADRSSKWYVVAFGMIGASLSGITFISVPGQVLINQFSYFQVVLGYIVGYLVIAFVLLPVYYKMNLTSIYTYLENRYGFWSYKTGAFFFLISRTLGASLRLFLVADVLQLAIFDYLGFPFWVSVLIAVGLIWAYTVKGGMKTIVLTDTFQTALMLIAVVVTIYLLADGLGYSGAELLSAVQESPMSHTFFWDWQGGNYFWKQFLTGAFIASVLTGLDQDMMQKNLTCKNLWDAQKNVLTLGLSLVPVNFLFLFLGACLYLFAAQTNITVPENPDHLFQVLATSHLPPIAGIFFILGISAAAYSSADSALTSLTTSFCFDFLDFGKRSDEARKAFTRKLVHLGFSVVIFFCILFYHYQNNTSILGTLFTFAGYTYGPLFGLYFFGLLTKRQVRDNYVPIVAVITPLIAFLLDRYSKEVYPGLDLGYAFGPINGLLMVVGLLLIQKRN